MSDTDYLRQIFLDDISFLDVRSEIEFARGAFPLAKNLPILNTEEREQVGICYKKEGQDAAILLGHQLVGADVKQRRVEAWSQYIKDNPSAHLYCWRGGMRSNMTQQWLRESGVEIPLIPGGYKALRRVLLTELEEASVSERLVIIGGKTGVAKTPLINEWDTGVDLEGFAHHRGSSFGRRIEEPPCQVDFENHLSIDIMKKRQAFPNVPIFLEDESRNIGPTSLPLPLWNAMCEASIVVVEMPLEFRVQRVLQEYVLDMTEGYLQLDREQGFEKFSDYLLASLFRIRKRLGSEQYGKLHSVMQGALEQQLSSGTASAHEAWISALLTDYYDPMYEYQLAKKRDRVIFTGSYDEVMNWGLAESLST